MSNLRQLPRHSPSLARPPSLPRRSAACSGLCLAPHNSWRFVHLFEDELMIELYVGDLLMWINPQVNIL